MEITCPRCQSLHEIDPPASARARGPRSLKFRCSHCGHTFLVDPAPPEPAPDPDVGPPPLGDAGSGAGLEPISVVQVGGKVWAVPDVGVLHQWVLERRIDRDAQVSNHGLRWTRAGDRPDLAIYFSAADALAFQERNLRTELPPAPDDDIIVDAGEAEGDDVGMPVTTGPSAFPRAGLDRRLDFSDLREDTQEQTAHSMGVDEIPDVPVGFERVDAAERTERLASDAGARVALPGAAGRAPPPPPGLSTVTPTLPSTFVPPDLPRDELTHEETVHDRPTTAMPPGPALALDAEVPLRATTAGFGNTGGFFFDTSPVAEPTPPPAPAPAAPSRSPAVNAGPVPGPGARRDAFEDEAEPPPSRSGGTIGVVALGAIAVAAVAFFVLRGDGAPTAAPEGAATAAAPALPKAPEEIPAAAPSDAGTAGAATAAATPVTDAAPPALAATEAPKPTSPTAPAAAAAPTAPVAAASPARASRPPTERREAPAEARAEATGGSPRKLVTQGWSAIEGSDFQKAHSLFDRALQGGPVPEALYGRGYANEKLGDTVSAADDYCQALSLGSVSVDISREIDAGLRRVGRTCR